MNDTNLRRKNSRGAKTSSVFSKPSTGDVRSHNSRSNLGLVLWVATLNLECAILRWFRNPNLPSMYQV